MKKMSVILPEVSNDRLTSSSGTSEPLIARASVITCSLITTALTLRAWPCCLRSLAGASFRSLFSLGMKALYAKAAHPTTMMPIMLYFVILFIVIEDPPPYPSLHGGEYNLLEGV